MFQIPQIAIYNVEEKTENRIDLNLPVGYTANYVSFKLLNTYFILDNMAWVCSLPSVYSAGM